MSETGTGKTEMTARVGVYLCECGPNIAGKIDLDKVMADILSESDRYRNVELVIRRYGFLCSGPGKQYLEDEIKENGLTHLVVAACSPRDHDSTFMEVCSRTDLNPYLYRIVNIREQCSWVITDPEEATERAATYIRGSISRVLRQSSLFEKPLEINPDAVVIGGGAAGMEAALALSSDLRRVFLVEKSASLGGGCGITMPQEKAVIEDPNVDIYLETQMSSVIGFLGNFEIGLKSADGKDEEITAGAIILAIGSDYSDPQESGRISFSESDEVHILAEAERTLEAAGDLKLRDGTMPETIAVVHCVGREEQGYCSGVCCSSSLKLAAAIRRLSPETAVTSVYRDLCLPGADGENVLRMARESGVELIRTKGTSLSGMELDLEKMDGTSEKRSFDMIIPAAAIVPAADTVSLAEMLRIPLDEHGFFKEAHRMTDPAGTTTEGVFIAGTAHGPMSVMSSMRFARACAGQVLTRLVPGERIVPEVKVTEILEAYCTGCGNCLDVCVYGAIYADTDRGISVVNEAVCRGCGNCFASCPSGALRTRHFTNEQIFREVDEALR